MHRSTPNGADGSGVHALGTTLEMGRTMRVFTLLAAATGAVAVAVRARRRRAADLVQRGGDVVPGSVERREALLDDAIDDSFPASDPPSYWGRETQT
jgi:hypothetical protein